MEVRTAVGRVARAVAVGTAGAYGAAASALGAAGLVFGDRWWWLQVANVGAFWWLLPALPLAVVGLVRRRGLVLVTCGVAALVWCAVFGPLFVPPPFRAAAGDLTVATYNLEGPGSAGRTDHVEALVAAADPDVLLLQQVPPGDRRRLRAALPGLPHVWLGPAGADEDGEVGVLSRHPITRVERVNVAGDDRPTAVVTLDVGGRRVRVVPLHLASPCFGCPASVAPRLLEAQARLRRAQVEAVLAALGPGPTVVGGDLNTGALGDPGRLLRAAGLVDAHRATGWGPGTTRVLVGVPLRIDWLFAGGGLVPVSSSVGERGLSDHRPVIAELRFDGSANPG